MDTLQNIMLESGAYVVAVSGGVDSMALLHMLARMAKQDPGYKFVVAHFDHGIRADAEEDRKLVQKVSQSYGLPCVYGEGALGPDASEDTARRARYAFLRKVKDAAGAQAIITAHHQDDLLETAILNMMRGTGRKGLMSLRSHDDLLRPLLGIPKADIIKYAQKHKLAWNEDSTNADPRYLRNYVRADIMPKLTQKKRAQLLTYIQQAGKLDAELHKQLAEYLQLHPSVHELNRGWVVMLPHAVAREVLADWLRQHQTKDLSAKKLERLVVAAKTGAAGTKTDIDATHILRIHKDSLVIEVRTS